MREQLLLDSVELVVGEARRRKEGLAIGIAVLPDDHIATAQVCEVVGKCADRAQDRVGVPAGLVFDALTLHGALVQEVVEVDGKLGGH